MKKINITTKSSGIALALTLVVLGFSAPRSTFAAGPAGVNLGTAGNFVILAKTGISTTGSTLITGDIGVSPAAATFITGFGLTLSTDTTYATTPLVVGKAYAASYTAPTPTTMTTAISDMQTAYTDANGRTNPTATELGAGNLGGLTIAPGLYKWGTGVTIPTNVTLSGGSDDVWIFQVAQTLSASSGVKVILSGGAQAKNVYWVVAGQTTIGTTAEFNGNILDQTAIVLNTGAKLTGRALAQTAVTLDSNSVTTSGTGSTTVAPAPVVTPVVTPVTTNPSTPTGMNPTVTTPTVTNPNMYQPTTGMTTNVSTNATMSADMTNLGHDVRMIAMSLRFGSKGANVGTLQQFLISVGRGPASDALRNVGSTSYFGAMTRATLAEFQAKVGISPALGNFGPITRAYLAAHY
jgi:hypothetical protein